MDRGDDGARMRIDVGLRDQQRRDADEVLRKAAKRAERLELGGVLVIMTVMAIVFGGGAAWVVVHWLWPWAGPKLMQPCPMPTSFGKGFVVGWWATSAWVRMLLALLKERKARQGGRWPARGTYSGHR